MDKSILGNELEKTIERVCSKNPEHWGHLFNALNARHSTFHHLALKAWDNEASCVLHHNYYEMQNEVKHFHQQWNLVSQSRNSEQARSFFHEYASFLEKKTSEIASLPCIQRDIKSPINSSIDTVMADIHSSFEQVRMKNSEQLASGIENVLNLKTSLNLTGSFSSEIKTAHDGIRWTYRILFASQIGLIIFATILAAFFAFSIDYGSADFWKVFAMKATVGVPIILIWTFLNSEFKVVRMEFMKMKHLLSLINGGATAVPQMVNESDVAKHDALSKIADSFVDLNQTMAILDKNAKAPELDLKLIIELADKIANRAK